MPTEATNEPVVEQSTEKTTSKCECSCHEEFKKLLEKKRQAKKDGTFFWFHFECLECVGGCSESGFGHFPTKG